MPQPEVPTAAPTQPYTTHPMNKTLNPKPVPDLRCPRLLQQSLERTPPILGGSYQSISRGAALDWHRRVRGVDKGRETDWTDRGQTRGIYASRSERNLSFFPRVQSDDNVLINCQQAMGPPSPSLNRRPPAHAHRGCADLRTRDDEADRGAPPAENRREDLLMERRGERPYCLVAVVFVVLRSCFCCFR